MVKPQRDVGQQALDRIYQLLQIDESWSSRESRSFSWIAHRLTQKIEASPVFESRGIPISRIISRVTVVEDVELAASAAEKLVAHLNHMAIGSALSCVPEERHIDMILGHIVHDETLASRSHQVGAFAMLQLAVAERQAEPLADLFSGRVARRHHPTSGERIYPDDMLNVLHATYLPAGGETSRFANAPEIDKVYQLVYKSAFFSAGGSADGIVIEVPFGPEDTSLIELSTVVQHPNFGTGLGVFVRLRTSLDEADGAKLANQLNVLQFEGGKVGAALGAWCLYTGNSQSSVGHALFIPNAHFQPDVALDAAMGAIERALWVDSVLYPGLPVRSSLPIVGKRMGMDLKG